LPPQCWGTWRDSVLPYCPSRPCTSGTIFVLQAACCGSLELARAGLHQFIQAHPLCNRPWSPRMFSFMSRMSRGAACLMWCWHHLHRPHTWVAELAQVTTAYGFIHTDAYDPGLCPGSRSSQKSSFSYVARVKAHTLTAALLAVCLYTETHALGAQVRVLQTTWRCTSVKHMSS